MNALLPVARISLSKGVAPPSVIDHHALAAIDFFNAHAEPRANAVVPVPIDIVEDDVLGRLLARQHHGKQNAVVVDVRFIAENGDFEVVAVLEDLLHASDAGHAVAHHDQSSLHGLAPAVASTRTAHCL